MGKGYAEVYADWLRDPEGYWAEAARSVDWISPPSRVFAPDQGVYGRWFPDATCNTCFNALDRHVLAGRGAQPAILYDSPLTGIQARFTYAELLDEVEVLAGLLQDYGAGRGDRVVIYMPMIPQALCAMLACARIGVIHSVVFGGFAPNELAKRIDDATPKLVLTASCGLEPGRTVAYKPLLDMALTMARVKPAACLVWQRPELRADLRGGRDHDWAEAVAAGRAAGRRAGCVEVAATDPLYILYTSGTTGVPKGVVRDHGGHMVALIWSMRYLYGMAPGEVWWTASDIGWVVGHSYIVYAPLLIGATSVLYEGKPVGTPDAGAFWRVIASYGVRAFFTAPTALRAVKKEDPEGRLARPHDLGSLRALFLAGERADPASVAWTERLLGIPVIDHWWQTETGWAIAGNPLGLGALPVKHGSPTVPMPGYAMAVLDDAGRPLPRGSMGALAIRLPLPPGSLPTLWQDDARMRASYLEEFPGHYKTADAGFIDEDGYLFIMGRTDDIINVAGHRLSTGGMEEVLASHPDVAECAVIGRADPIKGEVPLGFVVLKSGATKPAKDVEADVVGLVRERIGPVAAFKTAIAVARLPKTRSGKILRGTMKKIADGEDYTAPATIEDPAVLDEIAVALRRLDR
ncbi:MAG TPA: AMP-binding protein [Lichenihabitans sp.]|jgi:propionyl-CoA synthetase|nr:AMP-binding protein [Lichenihabitans sp.]